MSCGMSSRSAKILAALKTAKSLDVAEVLSSNCDPKECEPFEVNNSCLVGSPESVVSAVIDIEQEDENIGNKSPKNLAQLQRVTEYYTTNNICTDNVSVSQGQYPTDELLCNHSVGILKDHSRSSKNVSPKFLGFPREPEPFALKNVCQIRIPVNEPVASTSFSIEQEDQNIGNNAKKLLFHLQTTGKYPNVCTPNSSVSRDHEAIAEILCENSDDSLKDPNYQLIDENDSETSDESNDSSNLEEEQNKVGQGATEPRKGRKRTRNTVNWKCNVRKQKRLSGEEYLCKRNTLIKAKSLGMPCKDTCRYKCARNVKQEERENIFSQFWSPTKSIDQKRQFVASSVNLVGIKRRRERTGERANKKSYNKKFFFTVQKLQVEVCKTFFLNTLGISQTFVSTALSKKYSGGMVETDMRGKKTPPNKIATELKDTIRNHILKFPTVESHYSRERSSKRYLDSSLNITRMYDAYKQEMLDQKIPEIDIPKLWLYSEIFNNEFNYSFKPPDNDTCDQCDKFLIKLKDSTVDERLAIQKEYDAHLSDASNRYALKAQDKENAKQNKKLKVIMVDLEKCLPTPALSNAQSFYSLKLWTFNYTIKDSSKNLTTCCMWDESVAGRGGNEIASCLLKWALSTIDDSVEELIIWSDNCPSQNRNMNSILGYFTILKFIPTLKIINHKYLLRGHTHLEVDSDHSIIERERKKMAKFQIMTPWDWQQLVRLASHKNPFSVINMETADFKNFMSLVQSSNAPFLHRKKLESGKDFKISQLVHIQVRSDPNGKVFCKTGFAENGFEILDLKRVSRSSIFPDEIPVIRNIPKPISDKKYKDLQNLLQWVPKMFHTFYQNLPHTDKNNEDVTED